MPRPWTRPRDTLQGANTMTGYVDPLPKQESREGLCI